MRCKRCGNQCHELKQAFNKPGREKVCDLCATEEEIDMMEREVKQSLSVQIYGLSAGTMNAFGKRNGE